MEAHCVHFTHYVHNVYIVHFAINPLSSKWKPWVEPSGSSGHPAFHARDQQLSSPYHQVNHRHHHDQDHLQVNHLQDLDRLKSIIIILKIIIVTFGRLEKTKLFCLTTAFNLITTHQWCKGGYATPSKDERNDDKFGAIVLVMIMPLPSCEHNWNFLEATEPTNIGNLPSKQSVFVSFHFLN